MSDGHLLKCYARDTVPCQRIYLFQLVKKTSQVLSPRRNGRGNQEEFLAEYYQMTETYLADLLPASD